MLIVSRVVKRCVFEVLGIHHNSRTYGGRFRSARTLSLARSRSFSFALNESVYCFFAYSFFEVPGKARSSSRQGHICDVFLYEVR